jgi:hypothetical protein
MNKLKLLEMSAKAYGLHYVNYDGLDYDGKLGLQITDDIGRHTSTWNPLDNNSDAFVLAVKLGIDIDASGTIEKAFKFVCAKAVKEFIIVEETDELMDIYAATRLAITKAAALVCALRFNLESDWIYQSTESQMGTARPAPKPTASGSA